MNPLEKKNIRPIDELTDSLAHSVDRELSRPGTPPSGGSSAGGPRPAEAAKVTPMPRTPFGSSASMADINRISDEIERLFTQRRQAIRERQGRFAIDQAKLVAGFQARQEALEAEADDALRAFHEEHQRQMDAERKALAQLEAMRRR